jgi:hypothetical protein
MDPPSPHEVILPHAGPYERRSYSSTALAQYLVELLRDVLRKVLHLVEQFLSPSDRFQRLPYRFGIGRGARCMNYASDRALAKRKGMCKGRIPVFRA